MKLLGRKAIITGASQGFGLAVAEAFLAEGADLMLGARSGARLMEEAARLRGLAVGDQDVHARVLDVADAASCEAFMADAGRRWGRLDILVNNAGVYGPKGAIEAVDWQAWVDAIQTNLMGTVMMCRLGLPWLRRSPAGRVINLSGGGATAPMPRLSAYAASKAAVVRFTETLAEELRGGAITVNAVAPGALNTRLLDEVLEAGPEAVGEAFHRRAVEQKAQGGTPLDTGAALCAHLAGDAGAGITGKLVSAVWDPWRDFGALKDRFAGNDIYTLRRIVPKDRGQDF